MSQQSHELKISSDDPGAIIASSSKPLSNHLPHQRTPFADSQHI